SWQYTLSSQVTTQCNGGETRQDLVGGVTYTRDGDLIHPSQESLYSFFTAQGSCILDLKVAADDDQIADLVPRDDCFLTPTAGGGDIDVFFSFYRLTQSSVHLTPTDPGQPGLGVDIQASLSGPGGNCNVAVDATLIRAPAARAAAPR